MSTASQFLSGFVIQATGFVERKPEHFRAAPSGLDLEDIMKSIVNYLSRGIAGLCLLVFAGTVAAAVNVNTADAKAIAKELDGVGDKMASAIVKEREKSPFTSIDDLDKRIKGWGKKTGERNKDKIKFSDK